jgi:hypothetical protein
LGLRGNKFIFGFIRNGNGGEKSKLGVSRLAFYKKIAFGV